MIFEDTFEREELGKGWRVAVGDFQLANGKLIGNERPEDKHGAVARAQSNFKNGVVEFSFRMGSVKTLNFVIDQRGFKGSHAGHLCRVVITPKRLRLADDKEGIMRNDIFAMKDDPSKAKVRESLLAGRSVYHPVSFDPMEWYTLSVVLLDQAMYVSLDDKYVGSLQSPYCSRSQDRHRIHRVRARCRIR